jgi:hypothetical protein
MLCTTCTLRSDRALLPQIVCRCVGRRLWWQYGSVPTQSDRSLARIEIADLLRLAVLASDDEADLFRRNPQGSGRYVGRLLGRALCQGAALHYVGQSNGIKDRDGLRQCGRGTTSISP